MRQAHAEVTAEIAARPAEIYAILSDYRYGHAQILPKPYFVRMDVEQGGQGAGTVIRVYMQVLGIKQEHHMVVSEPEPGRVLAEKALDKEMLTTFTVTPTNNGEHASVRIATDWQVKHGLVGLLEGFVTGLVMRRIYRKELQQLAAYVQKQRMAASTMPS